jgi:hypothetical protein
VVQARPLPQRVSGHEKAGVGKEQGELPLTWSDPLFPLLIHWHPALFIVLSRAWTQ